LFVERYPELLLKILSFVKLGLERDEWIWTWEVGMDGLENLEREEEILYI